ncbi:uncharacterized protein [Spinacia oleracea]|uniref:Uncharacterized protein isoform X2 n=1 Tax=Spinacia oleracea TaxID=3562 RepID=A0ABM3R5R2_SPIOL|nr:uncharacterized protein LOC110800882 isoform X2 [Spinacia oleracea]
MVNENEKQKKQQKKKVPDWLNSSLWSTPFPSATNLTKTEDRTTFSDDGLITRTTDRPTSSDGVVITRPPSPVRPPPPPPPPSSPPFQSSDSNGTSTSSASPSPEEIARQAQLLVELSKKVINMREIRRLASMGLPDAPVIRSTVWKLLLAYLPSDRAMWPSELAKKRSQYKHFKDDLLMSPSEISRKLEKSSLADKDELKGESRCVLSRSEIVQDEHPLSLGQSSLWNQFFQDTEIIEQIDRDVKRTHPDMHFFSGDTVSAKLNQDALRNILIVFAKLNPGIRYVQGMNELLAPLFYVFRNDPDDENSAAAEADTFFCFVELLSGLRDNFCQQLDNSVVGIRSTITKLSLLLKEHDEELWRHLEITCKETLLRVCCAMLILIRRRLLAGDFTSNLKLLQNYPSTNISHLLYVANKLRAHPTS